MSEQEQAIIETVPTQSLPVLEQLDLSLLLKYGGGAAAIILSISILLLAVAEMIKVANHGAVHIVGYVAGHAVVHGDSPIANTDQSSSGDLVTSQVHIHHHVNPVVVQAAACSPVVIADVVYQSNFSILDE